MKLKHLLALIWVLAYSSESGKFKFFNFETWNSKKAIIERADDMGVLGDCPEYIISVDTQTLFTTKYYFQPPYCVPGEKDRRLVEQDTSERYNMCAWAREKCANATFKQCAEWISDYCPD